MSVYTRRREKVPGRHANLSPSVLGRAVTLLRRGHGYGAIAAELGVDKKTAYYHLYRFRQRDRTRHRWTPDEDAQLLEGLRAGRCIWALAWELSRSPAGVHDRATQLRHQGAVPLEDEALTGFQAGLLLGCIPSSGSGRMYDRLTRWIDAGALVAERTPGGHFRISRLALLDFLHDPAYWPEWEPFRLTDPDWRREFVTLRGLNDCLTAAQIEERYGLSADLVRYHARRPVSPLSLADRTPRERYFRCFDVETHDWTGSEIPARKGKWYGRLRYPPRQPRRLRQKDHDARLADDVFGRRREGAA